MQRIVTLMVASTILYGLEDGQNFAFSTNFEYVRKTQVRPSIFCKLWCTLTGSIHIIFGINCSIQSRNIGLNEDVIFSISEFLVSDMQNIGIAAKYYLI